MSKRPHDWLVSEGRGSIASAVMSSGAFIQRRAFCHLILHDNHSGENHLRLQWQEEAYPGCCCPNSMRFFSSVRECWSCHVDVSGLHSRQKKSGNYRLRDGRLSSLPLRVPAAGWVDVADGRTLSAAVSKRDA